MMLSSMKSGASAAASGAGKAAAHATHKVKSGVKEVNEFLAVESDETVHGQPDEDGRWLLLTCGVEVEGRPYSARFVADGDRKAVLHVARRFSADATFWGGPGGSRVRRVVRP